MPGGRGRRAKRGVASPKGTLGPLLGWVAFTLVMTGGVLVAVGVSLLTVAWLLAAGFVVGLVLLAAAKLSPPALLPPSPPEDTLYDDDSREEPPGSAP